MKSLVSLILLFCATHLFANINFNQSELFPNFFIHSDNNSENSIILVEKRGQMLYVLNNQEQKLNIIQTFDCSTGKISGDKIQSGDHKTPEGVYFVRGKKDSAELSSIYGAGAWVLDYPNKFDHLQHKNGYGIWIHGTDEPERIESNNDTRGCVVLRNENFLQLSNFIQPNRTPIIIVEEVHFRNAQFNDQDRDTLLTLLNDWKQSWENRDAEQFMTFYSRRFSSKNRGYSGYRAYKRSVFRQYKTIKLDFEQIQIYRHGEHIVINFYQKYQADEYADYGLKQLYLVREKNQFKIVSELWTEIPQEQD